MTRTKKHSKPTLDFPTMFYHSLPAKKAPQAQPTPHAPRAPSDLRKRQILMWSGVIMIMAFLIALWGVTLKERISIANNNAVNSDFSFLKSKNELSEIFRENNQKVKQLKSLDGMIKQALANTPTSSSISAMQIEELKKKIESNRQMR